MTVYFECTTRTTMSQERLFDLSRSIDTHTGSMAKSRETAIAGVTSGVISEGEEVTWRAWHFGLPLRMTSRITEMQAPLRFVDEQVRGPFKHFRHVHEFTSENSGAVMVDRIEFSAPFGIIGRVLEQLILAKYLQRLIAVRNSYIAAA